MLWLIIILSGYLIKVVLCAKLNFLLYQMIIQILDITWTIGENLSPAPLNSPAIVIASNVFSCPSEKIFKS